MNKFVATAIFGLGLIQSISADPTPPTVGSTWGHTMTTAAVSSSGVSSIYSDPLAHGVGDLITIVVDLDNEVSTDKNTQTSKAAAVNDAITSLVYPADATNKSWSWYGYHGQTPAMAWSAAHTFNGGGTIANTETAATTIQARVMDVAANGVMRVQATRMSRAGEEDTSMILTGFVRPEDLSSGNSINSSRVADLRIVQKGKGTITENQRKGWLTKLYEFLSPF